MNCKLTKWCSDFAILSFFYLATLFTFTCIGFFMGIPITTFHFYILSILFLILNFFYLKHKKRKSLEIIFLNIFMFLCLGLSIIIATKLFDISYDGQGYHQEAMIQLYNGWNPFLNPIIDAPHSIWISHYGKITWIIGTIFYKLTGTLESAKALNIFVAIPTILYSFSVLQNIFNKKMLAAIISILLLLNPVYTNQLLTSYVDQMLYIGFIIVALSIIQIILNNKDTEHYIMLTSGVIILSNVKFTGLGYAGILMLLFVIFTMISKKLNFKKSKSIILYFIGTFTIAVIISGFNPYITNLKMGHPLYPLSGPNKVDIMTQNTPNYLRDDGMFKKFFKGYFGIPGSDGEDNSQMPWNNNINDLKVKIDLSLKNSYVYDTRIGGFGPFTALFICFIFISSIYLLIKVRDKNKNIYRFIFLGVFITTLINPESWWARYVPQLWFLMCINIYYLLNFSKSKLNIVNKAIGITMILSILISSYFPIKTCIKYNVESTKNMRSFLNILQQQSLAGKTLKINFGDSPSELTKNWFTPTRAKLEQYNIKYEESNVNVKTPNAQGFPNTTAVFVLE